jgi:hypothetical protein
MHLLASPRPPNTALPVPALEPRGDSYQEEDSFTPRGPWHTCKEIGGKLLSVKPWRLEGVLGKPLGRRA